MNQSSSSTRLSDDNQWVQLSVNQSSLAAFFYEVNSMLWLTVPPVLLVLGCFGNVMTIVVMRALRASDSTACLSVYFTALALSDLCLVVSAVFTYWPEVALGVPVRQLHDVLCSSIYFVFFVTSLTSAWFLMAMTGQRMLSVMVPHRVGVLCTVRRAQMITAALTSLACLTCLHILFNYRIREDSSAALICHNLDDYVADIFYLLVFVIASAIPFLFLVVANSVLLRSVLQSAKMSREFSREDKSQTTPRSAQVSSMMITLILVSITFLVLTLPVSIVEIYMEEIGFYRGKIHDEEMKAKLTLSETVAFLMWMSNSAVNFYLYVLSGRKFREETKRYLCSQFTAGRSAN